MSDTSGNNTETVNINGEVKPEPKIEKINNHCIEWGIMLTLQDNLNLRIGSTTWKKYISAAFWNYISTPINFTITLCTAFSAGQTGTQTIYMSQNQMFYLLMTTFLLSVVNTFFKLKERAVLNYNTYNQYNKFGSQFEDIYFTPIRTDKDILERLNKYKELQKKMNDYNEEENVENVNYFTLLIYYSFKYYFKHRMKRVNKDERFWVLDGKPNNPFYPRNRYNMKVEDYFIDDFNNPDHVDADNLFINFNYKNNERHDPYNFLSNFLPKHTNNSQNNKKTTEVTNKSIKRKKTQKNLMPKKEENDKNNIIDGNATPSGSASATPTPSSNSNLSFDEDSDYETSENETVDSEDLKLTSFTNFFDIL